MSHLQIISCNPPPMSVPVTVRTPGWVSVRRILEQNVSDLHKCRNLNHVKQVHAQVIKADLHCDHQVAAKLVLALSSCKQIDLAVSVFNQIQNPRVHLYNSLIRAHVANAQVTEAFAVFFQMQMDGVLGDNYTYPALLKACSGQVCLPLVQMLHAQIEKFGFCADIFVPNSLLDAYSKCGALGVDAAMKLFSAMEQRDLVSWNTMICGLAKAGQLREARHLFDEMPSRDMISWNSMIDGYAKAGEMNAAFELFGEMPERTVVSWSTMIWGYCKSGDMEMARMMFDKMPIKNLVPWTIIISGYAKVGLVKDAMNLYNRMESSGLKIDVGTVISILASCAESSLLGLGMKVHDSILRTGLMNNTLVSNSLIDMFSKCGSIDKAMNIFTRMPRKDVVSWNIMIQGLANHGFAEEAIELYRRMKQEKFKPDRVTFICVLCACTHSGLVDSGLEYFHEMEKVYKIVPEIEHYGCLVDLLGRSGRLKEAFSIVQKMPFKPNDIILGTLIGACRLHNHFELADLVRASFSKLEESDSGNLSMLSNICAASSDWDGAANVRTWMKNSGAMKLKLSGTSSIEVDDQVREFTAFDTSHSESGDIYSMVSRLDMGLEEVEKVPLVPH